MNTPVITVNGQPLTRFELTNTMQEYSLQMHEKTVDQLEDEQHDQILQTAVEKLLVWELIYQRSIADGAEVSDDVVDKEIGEIAEQFETREKMYEQLKEFGVDPDVLLRSVRREVLVENVLDGWFQKVPEPSAEEIETGYREYLAGREKDGEGDEPGPLAQGEALSLEDAGPMIRSHCIHKAGTELIRAWVDELREAAEIEYLEEL